MNAKRRKRIGTRRRKQISMLKCREVGKLATCSVGNRGKSKEKRELWQDAGRENARRLRDRLVSMASRNVSRSNARTFDPVRLSFETASCAEEAKRIADPRYLFFFFLALLPATDGVVDASRCALGCTNRKPTRR